MRMSRCTSDPDVETKTVTVTDGNPSFPFPTAQPYWPSEPKMMFNGAVAKPAAKPAPAAAQATKT